MTTTLKQEIITLIISAIFLVMILTLLVMKIITPDNPLVSNVVEVVLLYWGFNGAYRFNPSNPSGTPPTSPAPLPTSQPPQ